jgi:hypothetical protein
MREAVGKSSPAVDIEQDIRDLAGRQHPVGRLLQLLSLGWRARLHGRDDQLSAGEVDTIELALISEPRHLLDFAVERRPAAGEIAFHVGVDRDRQWPLGLEQREGRLRNQVALEVLILAAAFDPDIAGAQPIPQFEEGAQFVGLAINLATLDDERPPAAPNEADRRLGRQRSLPRSVKRLEHVERVDDRLCRRCSTS